MKQQRILILMSLFISFYLLFLSAQRLNVAPSMNSALLQFDKSKIDSAKLLDSAKALAFHWREQVTKNYIRESKTATWEIIMLLIVAVSQIVLFRKVKRIN